MPSARLLLARAVWQRLCRMIRPRDPGAHAYFLTSGCTQRYQESADPSMRVRDLSAWYQTTPELAGTRDGAPALSLIQVSKIWMKWITCGD